MTPQQESLFSDSRRIHENEVLKSMSFILDSYSDQESPFNETVSSTGPEPNTDELSEDNSFTAVTHSPKYSSASSLVAISCKCIAQHHSYESVSNNRNPEPIPQELQLWISKLAFPDDEKTIELYSCLANGTEQHFQTAQNYLKPFIENDPTSTKVTNCQQIGFHLSAKVDNFETSVIFDRCKITSCSCDCRNEKETVSLEALNYQDKSNVKNPNSWCSHVIALCLYRIRYADIVPIQPPISESLSSLNKTDLLKFCAYLLDHQPKNIPKAQKLINCITSSEPNELNTIAGGPDLTAGASIDDPYPEWYLDKETLRAKITKDLIKFESCAGEGHSIYSPDHIYSQADMMLQNETEVSIIFEDLLKPLNEFNSGHAPDLLKDSLWGLLEKVTELFHRQDKNSLHLLSLITEQLLSSTNLVVWWYKCFFTAAFLDHEIIPKPENYSLGNYDRLIEELKILQSTVKSGAVRRDSSQRLTRSDRRASRRALKTHNANRPMEMAFRTCYWMRCSK